jgi:hypothetical protein
LFAYKEKENKEMEIKHNRTQAVADSLKTFVLLELEKTREALNAEVRERNKLQMENSQLRFANSSSSPSPSMKQQLGTTHLFGKCVVFFCFRTTLHQLEIRMDFFETSLKEILKIIIPTKRDTTGGGGGGGHEGSPKISDEAIEKLQKIQNEPTQKEVANFYSTEPKHFEKKKMKESRGKTTLFQSIKERMLSTSEKDEKSAGPTTTTTTTSQQEPPPPSHSSHPTNDAGDRDSADLSEQPEEANDDDESNDEGIELNPSSEIVKSGYLVKKGHLRRNW